jgi:hypothetical protein
MKKNPFMSINNENVDTRNSKINSTIVFTQSLVFTLKKLES